MPAVLDAELPYTLFSELQESPIGKRFISEEMLMERLRLSVRYIEDNFEFSKKIVEEFITHPIDIDDDRLMIDMLLDIELKCDGWHSRLLEVQKETPMGERYELNMQIIESTVKYKEIFQDLRWKLLVRDGMMDLR